MDRANSGKDFCGAVGLQEIAGGTSLSEGFDDVFFVTILTQNQDFRARDFACQFMRGVKPANPGMITSSRMTWGLVLKRERDGGLAVFSLAHDITSAASTDLSRSRNIRWSSAIRTLILSLEPSAI